MARLFNTDEEAKLGGPHIARIWLAELDLPSGISRLHNGVGTITANGYQWRGVTDPIGGTLVGIDAVEDPRFGQAAAVNIALAGITTELWKSVKALGRAIEGRPANLYWAMFDPETADVGIFKQMLPGRMSAPALHREGIGRRLMTLVIESFWQAKNFPFGGRWNFADQLRRFVGDLGGQFIGQKASETWR